MTHLEFEKALSEYGEAMFDCGEYDLDYTNDDNRIQYEALLQKVKNARMALIAAYSEN